MILLLEKLRFAQQKLQATELPLHLRVTAYLRISCFALEGRGNRYAQLMEALYRHNADWWKTCQITPTGELQSTDPVISHLIAPITALYSEHLPVPNSMNPIEPIESTVFIPSRTVHTLTI